MYNFLAVSRRSTRSSGLRDALQRGDHPVSDRGPDSP